MISRPLELLLALLLLTTGATLWTTTTTEPTAAPSPTAPTEAPTTTTTPTSQSSTTAASTPSTAATSSTTVSATCLTVPIEWDNNGSAIPNGEPTNLIAAKWAIVHTYLWIDLPPYSDDSHEPDLSIQIPPGADEASWCP